MNYQMQYWLPACHVCGIRELGHLRLSNGRGIQVFACDDHLAILERAGYSPVPEPEQPGRRSVEVPYLGRGTVIDQDRDQPSFCLVRFDTGLTAWIDSDSLV